MFFNRQPFRTSLPITWLFNNQTHYNNKRKAEHLPAMAYVTKQSDYYIPTIAGNQR